MSDLSSDGQTLGGYWGDDLEQSTLINCSVHRPCRVRWHFFRFKKLNKFPFTYTFRYLHIYIYLLQLIKVNEKKDSRIISFFSFNRVITFHHILRILNNFTLMYTFRHLHLYLYLLQLIIINDSKGSEIVPLSRFNFTVRLTQTSDRERRSRKEFFVFRSYFFRLASTFFIDDEWNPLKRISFVGWSLISVAATWVGFIRSSKACTAVS